MAAYLFSRGVVKQGHLHVFVRGVKKIYLDDRFGKPDLDPDVI